MDDQSYELQHFNYYEREVQFIFWTVWLAGIALGIGLPPAIHDSYLFGDPSYLSRIGTVFLLPGLIFKTKVRLLVLAVLTVSIFAAAKGSFLAAAILSIISAIVAVTLSPRQYIAQCAIAFPITLYANLAGLLVLEYLRYTIWETDDQTRRVPAISLIFVIPRAFSSMCAIFKSNLFILVADLCFTVLQLEFGPDDNEFSSLVVGTIVAQLIILSAIAYKTIQ